MATCEIFRNYNKKTLTVKLYVDVCLLCHVYTIIWWSVNSLKAARLKYNIVSFFSIYIHVVYRRKKDVLHYTCTCKRVIEWEKKQAVYTFADFIGLNSATCSCATSTCTYSIAGILLEFRLCSFRCASSRKYMYVCAVY